jgi:Helix-turn-helix domain
MSFQAMAWAIKQPLPTYEKFVLLALSNYTNQDNQCWPSIDTIASDTGLSRTSVKIALKGLEKRHILSVDKRVENRVHSTNIYTILMEGVGRNTTGGRSPHDPKPIKEPIISKLIDRTVRSSSFRKTPRAPDAEITPELKEQMKDKFAALAKALAEAAERDRLLSKG